jgi:hypothetical protein
MKKKRRIEPDSLPPGDPPSFKVDYAETEVEAIATQANDSMLALQQAAMLAENPSARLRAMWEFVTTLQKFLNHLNNFAIQEIVEAKRFSRKGPLHHIASCCVSWPVNWFLHREQMDIIEKRIADLGLGSLSGHQVKKWSFETVENRIAHDLVGMMNQLRISGHADYASLPRFSRHTCKLWWKAIQPHFKARFGNEPGAKGDYRNAACFKHHWTAVRSKGKKAPHNVPATEGEVRTAVGRSILRAMARAFRTISSEKI